MPTDVTIGPDGAYYVSELGGFPFVPETSRIWRIEPDQFEVATCSTFEGVPANGCEVYATGLTSVVSIDFDEGTDALFAVQIDNNGVGALEAGGAGFGSVQRVPAGGGQPFAVLENLVTPGGVDVQGGYLYVTEYSAFGDAGQVVRIAVERLNRQ